MQFVVNQTSDTAFNVNVSTTTPTFIVKLSVGIPGPAGGGLKVKAGVVPAGSFSGTPKTFAVVFTTPFTNNNYAVVFGGSAGRFVDYTNKSATGFTIETNSATANETSWVATENGET